MFRFDNWTKIEDTTQNLSKQDLRTAVARSDQTDCTGVVRNGDQESSLPECLARMLFYDGRLPNDWCDTRPDWTTQPLRPNVVLANAPERWLVSGAAIACRRERSGIRLNIAAGNLHRATRRSGASRYRPTMM